MATRVVYVNPDDLVEIRVINDSELPRNKSEWSYQVRPRSMLFQVTGSDTLKFSDPALRIELTTAAGKTLKICN